MKIEDFDFVDHNILTHCPPGWHNLFIEMCNDLDAFKTSSGLDFEVRHVKEKFGVMNVHVVPNGSYEEGTQSRSKINELYELVSLYETKSAEICQECGQPGQLNTKLSWILTLCKEHLFEMMASQVLSKHLDKLK